MKLLFSFVLISALVFAEAQAVAAAAPAPAEKTPAAPVPAPAPEPLPEPAPATVNFAPAVTLVDYINELTAALQLPDDKKKAITSYYQDDDAQLKGILNNDSTSPLDQNRQVNALRDARNTKIEALLGASDKIAAFLKIEAKYRVALLELDMAPVTPLPPTPAATAAPAPEPTPASPARTPPPE